MTAPRKGDAKGWITLSSCSGLIAEQKTQLWTRRRACDLAKAKFKIEDKVLHFFRSWWSILFALLMMMAMIWTSKSSHVTFEREGWKVGSFLRVPSSILFVTLAILRDLLEQGQEWKRDAIPIPLIISQYKRVLLSLLRWYIPWNWILNPLLLLSSCSFGLKSMERNDS